MFKFRYIYLNNHTKEDLLELYEKLIANEQYKKAELINYMINNGYYKEKATKNTKNTKIIKDLINNKDQLFEHVDDAHEELSEAELLGKKFEDMPQDEQDRINKVIELAKEFDNIVKDIEIQASELVYKNMENEHLHLPDKKLDKIYQHYYNYYLEKAKTNEIYDEY